MPVFQTVTSTGKQLVVPLFRFFKEGTSKKEVFGVQRRPQLKDAGLAVVLFVPYLLASTLLVGLAVYVLPFVNLGHPSSLERTGSLGAAELTGVIVILVILGPLLEELIFRGYIFKAFRERFTFWPSAILVSIAFGAVHGGWNVGIDTFSFSLFLCGLREYTGSLWASVMLHALKNGLAVALLAQSTL